MCVCRWVNHVYNVLVQKKIEGKIEFEFCSPMIIGEVGVQILMCKYNKVHEMSV